MNTERRAIYKIVSIIAVLIPVGFWLFILQKYAVDIPWFDDFDPFPDFLRRWILETNYQNRIQLVFQPNNEHRMVWGKITALLYYLVTGTLNFRFLQFVSAGFTIGTLFLFWLSFRQLRIPLRYFIPVPLFLFHIQYYGTFLWSICGMQHQPVIFFVALTCYLLGNNRFGWAFLAAVCANFAMSNGIFVWVSGAAILLFFKKPKHLIIWILAGAVCVGLYFKGMSPQGNEKSFEFLARYPLKSFVGFFTFLGGLFDLFPDKKIDIRNLATFIGGIISGAYAIAFTLSRVFHFRTPSSDKPKARATTAFLLGVIAFVLSNAAVIALLRPRFGMDVMLASNYKIYPGLFFAAVYCSLLLSGTLRRKFVKLGIVVSTFLWIGSLFIYLPTIRERSNYLIINAYNQKYNQFGLGFEAGSDAAKYIADLMDFLSRKKVYQLPDELSRHSGPAGTTKTPDLTNHSVSEDPGQILISLPNLPAPDSRTGLRFVYLRSQDKICAVPVTQNLNRGRNPFKKFERGAVASIQKSVLGSGSYESALYLESENYFTFLGTISLPSRATSKISIP